MKAPGWDMAAVWPPPSQCDSDMTWCKSPLSDITRLTQCRHPSLVTPLPSLQSLIIPTKFAWLKLPGVTLLMRHYKTCDYNCSEETLTWLSCKERRAAGASVTYSCWQRRVRLITDNGKIYSFSYRWGLIQSKVSQK